MAGQLKDKRALITGSTSGIGLGIAKALAQEGCHILFNGLGDPAEIGKTVEAVGTSNAVKTLYSPADMTQPNQIAEMIAMAQTQWGGLDILVNNAGVQHVETIETFPASDWDKIIAINLSSAFHTIQHAIPLMRANRFGRIINIASAHALVASPFKSAYVAAKHGLAGLTKVVALETAEAGITCNAICPGYVHTPLVEMQIEEQAKAHQIPREEVIHKILLAKQPNKQFVKIEELGAFAVFLCSTAAASITGSILPMDGGWTAE
jgi:3-hydroxybutyrate dehydrogenase